MCILCEYALTHTCYDVHARACILFPGDACAHTQRTHALRAQRRLPSQGRGGTDQWLERRNGDCLAAERRGERCGNGTFTSGNGGSHWSSCRWTNVTAGKLTFAAIGLRDLITVEFALDIACVTCCAQPHSFFHELGIPLFHRLAQPCSAASATPSHRASKIVGECESHGDIFFSVHVQVDPTTPVNVVNNGSDDEELFIDGDLDVTAAYGRCALCGYYSVHDSLAFHRSSPPHYSQPCYKDEFSAGQI